MEVPSLHASSPVLFIIGKTSIN